MPKSAQFSAKALASTSKFGAERVVTSTSDEFDTPTDIEKQDYGSQGDQAELFEADNKGQVHRLQQLKPVQLA